MRGLWASVKRHTTLQDTARRAWRTWRELIDAQGDAREVEKDYGRF